MTDSPLALQMAARVEKLSPPLVEDVCAAAALSVISLLDDDRSRAGGEWHDAVTSWNGARIRKIMRRARASAWTRVQEVPGVSVSFGTAEVRAFVPGPMAEAPSDVAKLQIQSSPLAEPDKVADLQSTEDNQTVMWLAITADVEMTWGKRAAQCAHAGQLTWGKADADTLSRWEAGGRQIRVIHPTPALWKALTETSSVHVHDGGFTEIPAGTLTAVGFW